MAYPVPRHFHRVEEIIRRSRFITSVAHTPTRDAAKAFIERIRAEFTDANHNCMAFVAGPPASTAQVGMSDDGEPRGTAGRPMLNTLAHSGVGEITAVVTRYFGGIKLGTGGLVRAYSGSVRQALADLPVREKIIPTTVPVIIGYACITPVRRLATAFDAEIIEETYGADVSLTFELPVEKAEDFRAALIDLTHGELVIGTS
ncbi:YigZ family protein [Desulfonema ishimotonii]|uniref:YigZ family protein n=1 Tax=Desulfonema ishimotonii TaxID=45657 RepID=A0A401FXE4_9BACT|nr:YigZ family protein [Desulfonema ishimotonii]GBC61658.1 YigZ family protein [Desulfonema ishimotonii]